jgi:hypothetical protein
MEIFPFTAAEWQRVQHVSLAVTNADLAEDAVLYESHFAELLAVLNELRDRYGQHPILLETEADFLDNPPRQVDLYRRAIRLAERHGLPTFSIRISLARLLLEEFANGKEAEKELSACECELYVLADESEKREWFELLCEARRFKQSKQKGDGERQ